MTKSPPTFDIDELLTTPTSGWHKKIAVDLISEIERHLVEIGTIPEMRRFLAVKGYRELHQRIEREIEGKSGSHALRAMAYAIRNYSLERPGLSAATFRDPAIDSLEWKEAGSELARTVSKVFAELGFEGEQAQHALRILRSLIRGFVIHEMAAIDLNTHAYRRPVAEPNQSGAMPLNSSTVMPKWVAMGRSSVMPVVTVLARPPP